MRPNASTAILQLTRGLVITPPGAYVTSGIAKNNLTGTPAIHRQLYNTPPHFERGGYRVKIRIWYP